MTGICQRYFNGILININSLPRTALKLSNDCVIVCCGESEVSMEGKVVEGFQPFSLENCLYL